MFGVAPFELTIFALGTFVAAFVTGAAGFAFGLVAAAIWLYVLSPSQTTALIVTYGPLIGGYALWKLRRDLNIGRLMPLILGSAIGVPVGILVLRWLPPGYLRIAIGAILILFSLYNLARPTLPSMKQAGRVGDAGAGFLNGVVGGSTGLAGIVLVIWSSLRGWQKDEQRAAFQPASFATFIVTLVALGGLGGITPDVLKLFALGLPVLAAGTWLGWVVYGKLDEAKFRKAVLVLLLASGVALMIQGL